MKISQNWQEVMEYAQREADAKLVRVAIYTQWRKDEYYYYAVLPDESKPAQLRSKGPSAIVFPRKG